MLIKLANLLGILPATFVITLCSLSVSFAVTIALALGFGARVGPVELAAAISIPLWLVPSLAYTALSARVHLHAAQETARLLAITDPSTETYNRRYFVDSIEKEIALTQRYGDQFSVLLIDMDNLQGINDAYHCATGDSVLRTVSDLCQAPMRRSDMVGRIGGDEFACLLPRTLNDGALEFFERLRQTIAATTVTVEENQVHFTISIGIKTLKQEKDSDAILRAANHALTISKNKGKNQCVSADLGLLPETIAA